MCNVVGDNAVMYDAQEREGMERENNSQKTVKCFQNCHLHGDLWRFVNGLLCVLIPCVRTFDYQKDNWILVQWQISCVNKLSRSGRLNRGTQ